MLLLRHYGAQIVWRSVSAILAMLLISIAAKAEELDVQKRKAAHWAWQPIRKINPPPVQRTEWPKDAIDSFIAAKLEGNGLNPAGPADRQTWIRRLYFDLIGLPPTPEEVRSFLADESPRAIERVVDRLLASPQFGERWGRHWLDLVRYAETRGHEFDHNIPNAYHYRDYVIRALNLDLPYDQFVVEHIAGDLLETPRLNETDGFNESILATGFWYLGEWVHSPVDIRQDELDRFENMIDVYSKTFLGMTLACARCHDHKFDAIRQSDYYAMAGYLQSSSYRQVRFDSMVQNRRLARKLEELRDQTRARLTQQMLADRTKVLQRLAQYLLEARADLLNGQPSALPAGGTATIATGLDADLVQKWAKHIIKAASQPEDPLHLWALMCQDGDKQAQQRRLNKLLEQWQKAQQRVDRSLSGTTTIIDYAAAGPNEWLPDGEGFGNGPQRAGQILLEPCEAARPTVSLYAAARRDPFWNGLKVADETQREAGALKQWVRAGQTLRTPTFRLNSPNVYYLVRGSGLAYAVVDSHRLIQGPLHGELLKQWSVSGDEPQWVCHELAAYQGHGAHIEFTPVDAGHSEILMVVQGGSAPPLLQEQPNHHLLQIAASAPQSSPEEIASSYQKLFQAAMSLASTAREDSRHQRDSAELARFLVERHDLFCLDPANSRQAVDAIIADYDHSRRLLADQAQADSRTAVAMWDGTAEDEFLLIRGDYRMPAQRVPRGLMEAIEPHQSASDSGSGRLQLARQVVETSNPLTSRVIVNRIWHHLFGRGLAASVDNLGELGEQPSHPDLLDYLAAEFMSDGWSVKRLVRRLVLTRTYQMSTAGVTSNQLKDPQNHWLHCMPMRRLQAETIRDCLLALSVRLDRTMYGPSIPIHLTDFQQGRGRPEEDGPLDGAGRRSIYLNVRRNFLSPMMLAFDAPIPFTTIGQRHVSNVPAQALILMNDPFVAQQAELWAQRLIASHPCTQERIERLYWESFSRPPRPDELKAVQGFLNDHAADSGAGAADKLAEQRLWANLCHVLLNTKELIYLQ